MFWQGGCKRGCAAGMGRPLPACEEAARRQFCLRAACVCAGRL